MSQVTIDLGKVKFQWRGAYDASTTYTKDDVVQHGGSSWVCVVDSISASAPIATNTSWNLMALGGDPVSLMTNEGDLLVRGSTGLERLPIGGEGRSLVVNGGVPEWDYPSGVRILQRVVATPNPGSWEAVASYAWVPGMEQSITPTRSDSRIRVHWQYHVYWTGGAHSIEHIRVYRDQNANESWVQVKGYTESAQYQEKFCSFLWDEPTSSTITTLGDVVRYKMQARDYAHNGDAANFHGTTYWDGGGGSVGSAFGWSGPVLTIEEYLP